MTSKNDLYSEAQRMLTRAQELLGAIRTACERSHPETNDWRLNAAEWLRKKAAKQEQTNAECPEHAAAYQAWRDRPLLLRMLADEMLLRPAEKAAECQHLPGQAEWCPKCSAPKTNARCDCDEDSGCKGLDEGACRAIPRNES